MNTKSFLFLIAVIVLASYGSSANPSPSVSLPSVRSGEVKVPLPIMLSIQV